MTNWVLVVVLITGPHSMVGKSVGKPSRVECETAGKILLREKRITSYHCFPPHFLVEKP